MPLDRAERENVLWSIFRLRCRTEERVSRGFDRRATRAERVHPASSVSAHTGPVGRAGTEDAILI